MRNLGNISDLYEQVKLNESKIKERKLTDAEKDKLKKLEKEVPMKDFKDRYGKEGEAVYYATLTKMAKKEGFASDAQRRAAFAQGYKAKGKKANKEQVQEWFESNDVRSNYELRYGNDWWWKLNEVHDAMLEKLGACCEDCAEEKKETRLVKFSEMNTLNVWGEVSEEAEYQGRKVKLNNPTRGDVKKFKVYVRNDKGNVVKVEYGDPNMEIKRDDPARRKSFRARHNCDNPGPKYKARYWSCKFWEKGKTVTDLMKG